MFIVNKKYACTDLATFFDHFIIFDDTKTIEDLLKKIEVILTTLYLTNRYYNENFLIEKVIYSEYIDLFYKKELEYFMPNDNSYTKLVNEIEKKVKREIKLDSILE